MKPQTERQTAILKLALHGGRKATAPDLTGEADNQHMPETVINENGVRNKTCVNVEQQLLFRTLKSSNYTALITEEEL